MMDFGFYNMDCMDALGEFPDQYFDLAIVDPPYGKFNSDKRGHMGGGHMKNYKYGRWDAAPGESYFQELFRVSKNQIIWGGNYFSLPPTRCFLVWRKTNIPSKFTMAMCEYAWTSFNSNAKIFDFSSSGIPNRFHPTQKPLELYRWILGNYAKDGDVILDTHVGSGSSLVACIETGHKYVGFEINDEYYTKAKERIDSAEAQMTLFDLGFNPYQE